MKLQLPYRKIGLLTLLATLFLGSLSCFWMATTAKAEVPVTVKTWDSRYSNSGRTAGGEMVIYRECAAEAALSQKEWFATLQISAGHTRIKRNSVEFSSWARFKSRTAGDCRSSPVRTQAVREVRRRHSETRRSFWQARRAFAATCKQGALDSWPIRTCF